LDQLYIRRIKGRQSHRGPLGDTRYKGPHDPNHKIIKSETDTTPIKAMTPIIKKMRGKK
jgi:hypothetical protein